MKKTLISFLLITTTLLYSCSSEPSDLNKATESLNKIDRNSNLDSELIESESAKLDSLIIGLDASNSNLNYYIDSNELDIKSLIEESENTKESLVNSTNDNSSIKIYKMKKKHHVWLTEMWWNNKWPFNKMILGAFDLIKVIKGSDFNELDDFFEESKNYDYEAITTLSPNYRIMFHNEQHELYKEVLLAHGDGAIGCFIILPKKKNKGNNCWFLTKEASNNLWLKIK